MIGVYVVVGVDVVGVAGCIDWVFKLRLLRTSTAPMTATATMAPITMSPNNCGSLAVGEVVAAM